MTKYLAIGAAFSAVLFAQEPPAPPAPPAPPTPATRGRTMRPGAVIFQNSGGFLGVGVAEVDSERARALKLPEERGVEVKNVTQDSPAAKAGIKEGDVVLEYNGQTVQGCEQFQRLVRETPVGRTAKLVLWRNGAQQTITATLAERKGNWAGGEGGFSINIPPMPPMDIPHVEMTWRNSSLGIEGQTLRPQLAEFFGVKEGVLVASVVKNSAAEKAGIKAGDIITKINETKVNAPRDITNVLRNLREAKTYTVVVVRNKKEMNMTITVPEPQKRKSGSRGEARAGLC